MMGPQYYTSTYPSTHQSTNQSTHQSTTTTGYPQLVNMMTHQHGPVSMMMPQLIQPYAPINQSASVQPLGSPQQQSTNQSPNKPWFEPYSLSNQPSPPARNLSGGGLPAQPALSLSTSHPPSTCHQPINNPAVIPLTPQIRAASTDDKTPLSGPIKYNSLPEEIKDASLDIDTSTNLSTDPSTNPSINSSANPSLDDLSEKKKKELSDLEDKRHDIKRQYLARKEKYEHFVKMAEELKEYIQIAETKRAKFTAKKESLLKELLRYEGHRISGGVIQVDHIEKQHPTGKRSRLYARCMQQRQGDGGLCYHPILTARDKARPCIGVEQHADEAEKQPSAKKRKTKAKD